MPFPCSLFCSFSHPSLHPSAVRMWTWWGDDCLLIISSLVYLLSFGCNSTVILRLQQSSSFRSSKAQLAPPSGPTASSTSFPSPKAASSMPSQPRRSRSISPVQPQKSRKSQPRSRPSSSVITRTVPSLMRTGSPSQVVENIGPASTMYPGVWQALGFRHKDSVLNPEDISSPICVTGDACWL